MMNPPRKMVFNRFDYAAFTTFIIYAAGSVVLPVVLVSLARELGFSLEKGGMSAGGALSLGRNMPMVVSMLLCGVLAGKWGKRRSLGWSVALMGLGIGLSAMAPTYAFLLVALMLAGIGEGVIEGLATPFVQDLHGEEPGRYINFTHAFWSVGIVATVLITGTLLSLDISWRWIIGSVAATALIPAIMLLAPSRKGHEYPEHPHRIPWKTVQSQAITILKIPRFWLFFAAMFVAGGGEFCLTFWCASYIQLNFIAAAWAGGVGTASFAAGMVLGRTGWGYVLHQRHLKSLVFFSAVAGIGVTLFFPILSNLWLFFALLFLAGVATAPFWPSIQSHCVDCLPATDATMLYILLSCAGVPGCGFFTWLMGYIANHSAGLSTAFYLVPACYLILAALIGYDWYQHGNYANS